MKPAMLQNEVIRIARAAGEKILKIYLENLDLEIQVKSDNSPLTKADLASHQIIETLLLALTPELPILSEESENIPYSTRKTWERYWLIDPLDGTQEFIHRKGDFSVNIALVEAHEPVLGVVYVPVEETVYYACRGLGAFKQEKIGPPCRISSAAYNKEDVLRVAVSRRHGSSELEAWLSRFSSYQVIPRGSAFKICLVADGTADLYPRFGKTSEWDTAAGQCILEEAGGVLLNFLDKTPLKYNTHESLINPEFLAIGDKTFKPW